MLRWLLPPRFEDEDKRLSAAVLHYSLLILIGVSIAYNFGTADYVRSQFSPVLMLTLIGAFGLLHMRRLYLSSFLLIGSFWALITTALLYVNGIFSGAAPMYTLLVVLSGVFLKPAVVGGVTVLCLVSVLVLGALQGVSLIPINTLPPALLDRVFYHVTLFSTTGVSIFAVSTIVRRTLARVRESEAALRRRNEELEQEIQRRQEAEERERALAIAKARSDLQTDFFNTFSHDLKTPLAAIKTSLYLLQRAQTDAQRAARAEQISQHVSLIDKYVQEMLTITRLEQAPASLMLELLSLSELVSEALKNVASQVEKKSLTVEVQVDPGLPPVQGDRDQLLRMLTNLLENAVIYTPPTKPICVTLRQASDELRLTIADSGIGIEPEAMPHIFEPFYRTNSARAVETRGTGLGLAIVKKIAEHHNTHIDVRSVVGQGTTFELRFPTLQPAPQSADAQKIG
jgi:signal transduction histidine kinase